MTTITGKIESAAGETLHATIDFVSRSTPQFPAGVVQTNTSKRIRSDASTGEFSIQLAAGNWTVTVKAKGQETTFTIAVPDGDDTFSIEDLVTSSVSELPGVAPYTLWNGVRAGHITFDPIPDPVAPTLSEVAYTGGEIAAEDYLYAVSYVTQEGETGLSPVVPVTGSGTGDRAIRVALSFNPERVTAKRIWRNYAGDGNTTFALLATVAPSVSHYDDWESLTDFADRASGPGAPGFNTTAGKILAASGQDILYFSTSGLRCLTVATFDLGVLFSTNFQLPTGAGAGKILTSDADGVASWQTLTGGLSGSGSPEGGVTASPGATYLRTSDESFWMKKTGTGNTGWIQLLG